MKNTNLKKFRSFPGWIFLFILLLLGCITTGSNRLRYVPQTNESPSTVSFQSPLKKIILLSHFGLRRGYLHKGIDIRDSRQGGEPVMASANGYVISAMRLGLYGKMVLLQHSDGYFSRYAHLRKIKVKIGQYIKKGHVLGTVGKTGNAKTNHLHFEILTPKKVPVDPYPLIKKKISS